MPPKVWINSMPSGWTRPSSNGATRSLLDDMKLSRSFGLLTMGSPPQWCAMGASLRHMGAAVK